MMGRGNVHIASARQERNSNSMHHDAFYTNMTSTKTWDISSATVATHVAVCGPLKLLVGGGVVVGLAKGGSRVPEEPCAFS